ncbi:hypothetical protein [Xanthomonas graminis]|nr:hypothetical protein [Xanthomonas translucens]
MNARGHIMLEVIRSHFKLSPKQMRQEIVMLHGKTVEVLRQKGIDYGSLRSGLAPVLNRHEAAFIFDSSAIKSSWYAREVFAKLLPLLEPASTQSLLCGDLLGNDQDFILKVLRESLILSRSLKFRHGTLLFAVYINNLSEGTLNRMHSMLSPYPAYVGYIPTTFGTRAKTYLSTCLTNVGLKVKKQMVLGHEDDRPNHENVNLPGLPFEEAGYRVLSLQESLEGVFLSFKIERPVFSGFEADLEMSLNAISEDILSLDECEVYIEPAKHGYLLTEKVGKLQKARLADFSRDELQAVIQQKIDANYIYNMQFLEKHNVMKFSVMIEIGREDGYPTRLAAAFEYLPKDRKIRLITLH